MVTEEVEPGVLRVINDGVRDLSYPLGGWNYSGFLVDITPDGSVWMSVDEGDHGLFRLGEEPVFEDPYEYHRHRVVAPDGSLWAIGIGGVPDDPSDFSERSGIFSFDGEGWTLRATTRCEPHALAVGPDGTVTRVSQVDLAMVRQCTPAFANGSPSWGRSSPADRSPTRPRSTRCPSRRAMEQARRGT